MAGSSAVLPEQNISKDFKVTLISWHSFCEASVIPPDWQELAWDPLVGLFTLRALIQVFRSAGALLSPTSSSLPDLVSTLWKACFGSGRVPDSDGRFSLGANMYANEIILIQVGSNQRAQRNLRQATFWWTWKACQIWDNSLNLQGLGENLPRSCCRSDILQDSNATAAKLLVIIQWNGPVCFIV